MSETLARIRKLAARGEVLISEHGYDELAADSIQVRDAVNGLSEAVVIEDYPMYYKGPCVLVIQRDAEGKPIHVVWGIPKNADSPSVLVTAYRPEPNKWSDDFTKRR